jgi:hypothetical protein
LVPNKGGHLTANPAGDMELWKLGEHHAAARLHACALHGQRRGDVATMTRAHRKDDPRRAAEDRHRAMDCRAPRLSTELALSSGSHMSLL